jgi:hypothetical protein
VLELLQNADDAGVDYGSNRAALVLTPEGLLAANEGVPFSTGGLYSLLISDHSPKPESGRTIGNRGLGFRSLLSWSETPFILSGGLEVGFSRVHAESWVGALMENPKLRAVVEAEVGRTGRLPVPVLGVPKLLDDVEADVERPMLHLRQIATELRSEGYDTVVGVPFTGRASFDDAADQLSSLAIETLLFLQNLKALEIRTPSVSSFWRAERSAERVHLSSDKVKRVWRLWSTSEDARVPVEYLEDDAEPREHGYGITIAVPEEGVVEHGTLYNYLPTAVHFPYPVIAHAGLEITKNRQNLVESRANEYVAAELARLLVHVAAAVSCDNDKWMALRLVSSRASIDPVLEKLGFARALRQVAVVTALLPCRDGQYRSAEAAVRTDYDPGEWLPLNGFGDLVAWTSERPLSDALNWLEVPILSQDELRRRLEVVSPALPLDGRVAVLSGLLREEILPDPPPALLVDDAGVLIPADSSAALFLAPSSSRQFPRPEWLEVRMLDSELIHGLEEALGEDADGLVKRLRTYRVRRYAIGPLARVIHSRVEVQAAHAGVEGEPEVLRDGIASIRALFDAQVESGLGPVSQLEVDMRLRARDGAYRPASTLYLGHPYPQGGLIEALYGWDPAHMVAGPDQFDRPAEDANDERFLRWLGVATHPRTELTDKLPREFAAYVADTLDYGRATFAYDFHPRNPHELHGGVTGRLRLTSFNSIDRLDLLLEKADPHAIAVWLAEDARLESWRGSGDPKAQLDVRVPGKYADRRLLSLTLPSYVLWRLRTSAWLPTSGGSRARPDRCVARAAGLETLFPQPALDPEHPLFTLHGVDRPRFHAALERVGVKRTLAELSWDECYDVLLQLPEVVPDGVPARAFYNVLAEKPGFGNEPTLARERFLSDGLLWSVADGEKQYRPREKIFYTDDPTIPGAVLTALPRLEISTGNPERVERIFGVRVLRAPDVEVSIKEVEVIEWLSEALEIEFESLKPYLAALRLHSNPGAPGLARLRELKLVPCERLRGYATVHGRMASLELDRPLDQVISGPCAYLIVDPTLRATRLFADPQIARALGTLVAAVLGVRQEDRFAFLAMCPPEERRRILEGLVDGNVDDLLAKTAEVFPHIDETALEWPKIIPPPEPQPRAEPKPHEPELPRRIPEPNSVPKTLSAEPFAEPVSGAQRRRKIPVRVQPTPVYHGGGSGQGDRLTPRDAEQLAFRFEEAQQRFPIDVSHHQGYQAFGCDILTFESAEERDAFLLDGDPKRVSRFIEVKSGAPQLNENQASGARTYPERYYLYGVSDKEGGWRLAELQSPLENARPIAHHVELNSARTHIWHLTSAEVEIGSKAN